MRDFNHSVNVLVKAYFNNTLEHENCHACAVGNLIAEAKGILLTRKSVEESGQFHLRAAWNREAPLWGSVFVTFDKSTLDQEFIEKNHAACINASEERAQYAFPFKGISAMAQIDATGYGTTELARIEWAFESVPNSQTKEERMFNGLMAVVDVLADIHGIDLKQKEEAKSLFVKPCTIS